MNALLLLLAWSVDVLWMLLPVNAGVSIWRRRRNRPGARCRLAYGVLLGWALVTIASLFLALLLYSEHSHPGLLDALIAGLLLTGLLWLHLALINAGNPLPARVAD